jgi:nitroreductase
MNAIVRSAGRAVDQVFPALGQRLRLIKHRFAQTRKTWLHAKDAHLNLRYMEWRARRNLAVIEAELIFQYHKIEKGLCMPPPRRFFGVEPAKKTTELIREWEQAGGSRNAPAYLGAIEAMRAYREGLNVHPAPADVDQWLRPMLDRLLQTRAAPPDGSFVTPIHPVRAPEASAPLFATLMEARRSVRHFTKDKVPAETLRECVSIAQLSPSACNRQPWRVHAFTHKDKIAAMLKLQNGNAGFGHQLNTLLVITADRTSFFDASERNEPYIDGGLFAMSLILALQSHGVASCCLNWCVDHRKDQQAHLVGNIPEQEAIIMYLAVGYADETAQVPKSARKSTAATLVMHE